MEADRPWDPSSDNAGSGASRANPLNDSFKDDIQAIGRAVERLRDGFAGTDGSSPAPAPGHDSAQWDGGLSSSMLASGPGDESGHPSLGHGVGGQPTYSDNNSRPLVRESLPARTGVSGSLSFAEGDVTVDTSVLDRTRYSNGRLSLRELRSADKGRTLYSDERIRPGPDDAGDQSNTAVAVAAEAGGKMAGTGTQVSDQEGLFNKGSSSGSARSSSTSRRRANTVGRPSSPGGAQGKRTLEAPILTPGVGQQDDGQGPGARRETPEVDLLRLRGDKEPSLQRAVSRTASAEPLLLLSPLIRSSRSPSVVGSGGGAWESFRRERAASGDNSNSSSGDARKAVGGRDGMPAAVAESGSLFELRDALRSREEDLLRLKRDVSVVATSARGFQHLSASLGSGNAERSSSFASQRNRSHGKDANSANTDSDLQSHDNGSAFLGAGSDGGRDSGAGVDKINEEAFRPHRTEDGGAVGGVLQRRQPADSALPGTALSFRTASTPGRPSHNELASSQRLMPPPPRRQQGPTAVSKGSSAVVAASGSPLVASAHEGLQRMRAVLEQRALEVGRAHDDSREMANTLNDVTARLRRSERKRNAQAAELAEARAEADAAKAELSRHRAREAAAAAAAQREKSKNDTAARERATAAAAAGGSLAETAERLREREAEVSRLRDRLETATGELSGEQASNASLRARLEASEKETRRARERAAAAEEEASAAAAAQAAQAAEAAEAAAERARREAEAAEASAELRAAAEESRRQAAAARESLEAERESAARVALELEATVRERTQAVEKLAEAEAEAGRLHVRLSSVTATFEEMQSVRRERDSAVAEVANLTAALVLAREGQEAERGRFDRESKRAAALGEELVASEARRKVQEEEISLVRKQVSRLDAKIEGDMSRVKANSDATARATAADAEREANSLRASLREAKAEAAAARERARQVAENADASLKAELAAEREAAEAELAAAEAGAKAQAERAARAAQLDKDTLKRGLVASQTACAELRAERSRLLSELEHAATSAATAAAAAAASVGSASSFSSPTGGDDDDGGAAAKSAFVRARKGLEGRLALAVAEAAESRAEAQRLKRKLQAVSDREDGGTAAGLGVGLSARTKRRNGGGGTRGKDDDYLFGVDGDRPHREGLQEALRESCGVMERIASALSAAAEDRRTSRRPGSDGGGSELDDPRWAFGRRRRRGDANEQRSSLAAAPGSGRRRSNRRRRAFSVDSNLSGVVHDDLRQDGFGDCAESGRDGDALPRVVSRAEAREVAERLRFEAARLLGVRKEERKAAEDTVASLRRDLRDSESREAEVTARLEESRELSREQTGFVEGVWKERHRLEAELTARCEEAERLRASEDAARTAATVLDGKVADLSTALRQEQARAKREAEAAVAAEARDAMEALRQQLDDLRKEVDRTKQERRSCDVAPPGVAVEGPGVGGNGRRGESFSNPNGAGESGRGGSAAAGVVAPPSPPPTMAVLEGEFQRLRAKYEKAKGRIVALEELVAASRRVSAQARREFKGALEALKLSQELLLRIHRQRQNHAVADPSDTATPATHPAAAPALKHHQPDSTTQESHSGATIETPSAAPADLAAAVDERPTSAAMSSLSTDAHVHELAAQASKLRGMSGNVKRLLQLAAGEVQGALEDTRDSLGVAGAAAAAVGTQTPEGLDGPTAEEVECLEQQVVGMKAAAQVLEAEKSRLSGELSTAVGELAEVQALLGNKTSEALALEAQVARLETECNEAREAASSAANDRLAEAEAALSDTQTRLDDALATQRELRSRCAELAAAKDRLAGAEAALSDTQARLDAALATQRELRSRCAELSLASGAFASEVAKQKEERARSQERARLATVELRDLSAKFSLASEKAAANAAAERDRLERELVATRAEARDIDTDVAQVLDALASSEKERRRLEAELDRQTKMAARVQRQQGERDAPEVESGLKEREAERREKVERECKVLEARAGDLEAGLESALKKAAKTGETHEREVAALREEATRLRESLEAKMERERGKWQAEQKAMREEMVLAREDKASSIAEATEQGYEKGKAEEQQRTARSREREQRDLAALRKELSESTAAFREEASLRARAAEELSSLRVTVAQLEAALEKAAGARRSSMSHLKAEMRSVITSLDQDRGEVVESRTGGGVARRATVHYESTRSQPAEVGREGSAGDVRRRWSTDVAQRGEEAAASTTTAAAAAAVLPARAGVVDENGHSYATTPPGDIIPPPIAPPRRPSGGVRGEKNPAAASSTAPLNPKGMELPAVARDTVEGKLPAVVAAPIAAEFSRRGGQIVQGQEAESGHDDDDDELDSDNNNNSFSSVLSGMSSTTRASGVSSCLTSSTLPLPQAAAPRRESVVVRGDWKAGQREAFSQLDRKKASF